MSCLLEPASVQLLKKLQLLAYLSSQEVKLTSRLKKASLFFSKNHYYI